MPYKDPEEKRAHDRAYYKDHQIERLAAVRAYWETHQEECRARGRAYYESHREEMCAYNRARAKEHPEQNRARAKAWNETHPIETAEHRRRRRARDRNVIIKPINLAAIKERDRMFCCICGKKVAEDDFSLDHTIPLSLGGPHCQENLRVAHRRCNSQRGAGRLPVQMVLI